MKDKRAQEEIVGFVLIIVLVAVIVVVLLGISIRRPSSELAIYNEEFNSFISSVLYYTSDCERDGYFRTARQLIRDCNSNRGCDEEDERTACGVLKSTIIEILDNSDYVVSEVSSTIYYKINFEVGRESGIELIQPIEKISNRVGADGKCPGILFYGEDYFTTQGEKVHVIFEVCKERTE